MTIEKTIIINIITKVYVNHAFQCKPVNPFNGNPNVLILLQNVVELFIFINEPQYSLDLQTFPNFTFFFYYQKY